MNIEEAADTYFIVLSLTRLRFEPMIYWTGGEHANYYTTDDVAWCRKWTKKHGNFYMVAIKHFKFKWHLYLICLSNNPEHVVICRYLLKFTWSCGCGNASIVRISHGYTVKTFSNIHLKLNITIRLMTSTTGVAGNSTQSFSLGKIINGCFV